MQMFLWPERDISCLPSECPVSLAELEKLAWSGVPSGYRSR